MLTCVFAVYEVTNSDAENILKKAVQAPAENGVVRLRGLPFSCTEADIVQFFSGKLLPPPHLLETLGLCHCTVVKDSVK